MCNQYEVNAKSDPVVVRTVSSIQYRASTVTRLDTQPEAVRCCQQRKTPSNFVMMMQLFVKPGQRPKTMAEAYINEDEDSEDENVDQICSIFSLCHLFDRCYLSANKHLIPWHNVFNCTRQRALQPAHCVKSDVR